MNMENQTFCYERCYQYYTKRILNIRQAKIHGDKIEAKPVLLVAIIDGIDANVFMNNQFVINEWLEGRYSLLKQKYTRNSQFDGKTGIEKPYWHLESDGFWHLQYSSERPGKSTTPSKKMAKGECGVCLFYEMLLILLQNKVWRQKLRDYIVNHKLTDDFWIGNMAAEELGLLAALIVAA